MLSADTNLTARTSWVLHRASTAMLITSFTTACSFLSNTVNYVMPIKLFGGFMALLVTMNFLLVITVFPATVIIYHTWFEGRLWSRCLRWKGKPWSEASFSPLCRPERHERAGFGQAALAASSGDSDHHEGSRMDRCCHDVFAPAVYKFRFFVAGVGSLITLTVALTYSIHLGKADSFSGLWPADYMTERFKRADDAAWPDHFDTNYGCEPNCEDIYFVFGVRTSAIPHDSHDFVRLGSVPAD